MNPELISSASLPSQLALESLVSHLKPELSSSASLLSQLALGVPGLCVLGTGITHRLLHHPACVGAGDIAVKFPFTFYLFIHLLCACVSVCVLYVWMLEDNLCELVLSSYRVDSGH